MKTSRKISIAALSLVLAMTGTMLTGQKTPVAAAPTDATVQSYEQQLAEIAVKQKDALNRLANVRNDYSNV